MSLKDFYTREFANDGAKMFLQNPDGTISKEKFFIVHGVDSDVYREAKSEAYRKAIEIGQISDLKVRAEALKNSTLEMFAALVKSWNFEEPMTKEALMEFFVESPNNADRIDRFASERSNFFTKKSES